MTCTLPTDADLFNAETVFRASGNIAPLLSVHRRAFGRWLSYLSIDNRYRQPHAHHAALATLYCATADYLAVATDLSRHDLDHPHLDAARARMLAAETELRALVKPRV